MIIAIDFDGTIVRQEHRYDDLESPLELTPGAREGLQALKAAGHRLILWSGRLASRGLLEEPREQSRKLNQARAAQMLEFVELQLPGVFEAVDTGQAGKPIVDLFIDNQAIRYGHGPGGLSWPQIAGLFGEPERRGA